MSAFIRVGRVLLNPAHIAAAYLAASGEYVTVMHTSPAPGEYIGECYPAPAIGCGKIVFHGEDARELWDRLIARAASGGGTGARTKTHRRAARASAKHAS